MPICAPVGGRTGAAMNGQNTGAWSDVIRHCDSGAYPAPQPAPRSRGPRGDLSRGNSFAPRRPPARVPPAAAARGRGRRAAAPPPARAGPPADGSSARLRDIFRPTPRGMVEAMNPESAARSSRCGVKPARRIEDSSCRPYSSIGHNPGTVTERDRGGPHHRPAAGQLGVHGVGLSLVAALPGPGLLPSRVRSAPPVAAEISALADDRAALRSATSGENTV